MKKEKEKLSKITVSDVALVLAIFNLLLIIFCHYII